MTDPASPPFLWLGDHPAADFANTALIAGGEPADLLASDGDLLRWLQESGLPLCAEAMEAAARGKITGLLPEARQLRTCIKEAAYALAESRPMPESAIAGLNRVLGEAPAVLKLVRGRKILELRSARVGLSPQAVVAPVAEAAARLFAEASQPPSPERPEQPVVRRCENPDCVLLFVATAGNHRRRWCSMNLCGNVMKVRAHRARLRAAQSR
jgi:predicted RNA-binding Zn ribbon-like protein